MAKITLDQDQIIQNVNGRIAQDLAAAIKQVVKDGVWEEADEEEDGIDPERIIRRTMATYMGGSTPGWFLEAAGRAPAGKRMAALTKLIAISTPIGFLSGIPRTPIA